MQLLEDARSLPLVEAAPAGDAASEAELPRQVLPGDPRVEHEQDPLQRLPIGQALAAGIAEAPLLLR